MEYNALESTAAAPDTPYSQWNMTVDVDDVIPGQQGFVKTVKISTDQWEINIGLTETDIATLKAVRPGSWAERESLRCGIVGRAPVFWSTKDRYLTLLIGDDDESWDIAVTLPNSTLTTILKEL